MMKKSIFSSVLGLLVASFSAQAQDVPLVTNITISRPSCLPQNWNASFSGVAYNVFSVDNFGTVYSWNCLNSDSSLRERYAIVILSSFTLIPTCSSLGIDRLRVTESSAATSVFNMLTACGRQPQVSTSDWDKYTRLLTIGQAQPADQDRIARQWLGENYRNPVLAPPTLPE